jgi:plasmid stabilization system protein ParE
MAYLVSITRRAERDLINLYQQIDAAHSDTALRWYRALKQAILSLEENPRRCPATPEKKEFRHLLHGSKPHIYRMIYRILERQKNVEVLHVRHGARRGFKPADLARGDTQN